MILEIIYRESARQTGTTITPDWFLGRGRWLCGVTRFQVIRQKCVMGFQPSTAAKGYELQDGVHWNFNARALLDGSGSEVGDKHLKYTDVTHHHSKSQLLLHVNHY
jgi:hypothetical protein